MAYSMYPTIIAIIHSLHQHNVSFRDTGSTSNDVLFGWIKCLYRSFHILAEEVSPIVHNTLKIIGKAKLGHLSVALFGKIILMPF